METIEAKKVEFTGIIPICPKCDKPTKRSSHGGTCTLMVWSPNQ